MPLISAVGRGGGALDARITFFASRGGAAGQREERVIGHGEALPRGTLPILHGTNPVVKTFDVHMAVFVVQAGKQVSEDGGGIRDRAAEDTAVQVH